MAPSITIGITLTGTITISEVTPITAPTFVDWWTWTAAGVEATPVKIGSAPSSSALPNRVTQTLSQGKHMFIASILNTTSATLTVGGVAADVVETVAGPNPSAVQIWTYDVPSAGSYDIDIAPAIGVASNRVLSIFKVDDASTVTADTSLPVSSDNTFVVGMTATVNNPTYAPDTTSTGLITTLIDFDSRSNEFILLRQYDDLDADITVDADYGGTSNWVGIWAIVA